MLAMLPAPVSRHDSRHVPVLSTSTLAFSRMPPAAGTDQMRSSRPLLSINTAINSSKARSFGKGSSLSIHTLSAVSPTTKNTFTNTYQTTTVPSPVALQRPALPALATTDLNGQAPIAPAYVATTIITTQSQADTTLGAPLDVSSILVTSVTYHAHQLTTSSRTRTPASKRVSFREPLTEEIKTKKYTLAHSDIHWSNSADVSVSSDISYPRSESPTSTLDSATLEQAHEGSDLSRSPELLDSSTRKRISTHSPTLAMNSSLTSRPLQRHVVPLRSINSLKRDSSSEDDSSDEDAVPKTPVAGRCKRRREWVWTLDPVTDASASDERRLSSDSTDDDHESISLGSRFSESSS